MSAPRVARQEILDCIERCRAAQEAISPRGKYNGEPVAELLNLVPALLDELEKCVLGDNRHGSAGKKIRDA